MVAGSTPSDSSLSCIDGLDTDSLHDCCDDLRRGIGGLDTETLDAYNDDSVRSGIGGLDTAPLHECIDDFRAGIAGLDTDSLHECIDDLRTTVNGLEPESVRECNEDFRSGADIPHVAFFRLSNVGFLVPTSSHDC